MNIMGGLIMEQIEELGLDTTTIELVSQYDSYSSEELLEKLENETYIILDVSYISQNWILNDDDEETWGRVLYEEGLVSNHPIIKIPEKIMEEVEDYIDWEAVWRDESISNGYRQIRYNNKVYLVRVW